jgi:two-component system CheB/CheR fusion protein
VTNPKNPGSSVTVGPLRGETALERRLTEAEKYLETVLEDYESTTDVLRSTQNELAAANEELQSLNQDLTSANEELQRLKRELHFKTLELDHTRNELASVLRGAGVAIVVLDSELRITRFTPAAGALFHLREIDIGKPIREILPSAEAADLENACMRVLKELRPQERVIGHAAQHWTLSIRPYRTGEHRVEGIVILILER